MLLLLLRVYVFYCWVFVAICLLTFMFVFVNMRCYVCFVQMTVFYTFQYVLRLFLLKNNVFAYCQYALPCFCEITYISDLFLTVLLLFSIFRFLFVIYVASLIVTLYVVFSQF